MRGVCAASLSLLCVVGPVFAQPAYQPSVMKAGVIYKNEAHPEAVDKLPAVTAAQQPAAAKKIASGS